MNLLSLLLFLTGAWPLWQVWRANRRTSLLHAVYWATLAWVGWTALSLQAVLGEPGLESSRYVALCLTGCASVAVLGARRPGLAAWNFVLLGLLAVMLLPLAERLVAGAQRLDPVRLVFLCGTLAVGVLNYLPTRLGPVAVWLGFAVAGEVVLLLDPSLLSGGLTAMTSAGQVCLSLVPWLAYLGWHGWRPGCTCADGLWLSFRDRFGLFWSLRLREQLNRAAVNTGWPLRLQWQGFRLLPNAAPPEEAAQTETITTLRALLKRFLPEASLTYYPGAKD